LYLKKSCKKTKKKGKPNISVDQEDRGPKGTKISVQIRSEMGVLKSMPGRSVECTFVAMSAAFFHATTPQKKIDRKK